MSLLKANWLDEFSVSETLDIAMTLARHEAELSGSFRAELSDLLDRRDWKELLDFDFRYHENRAVMDYVHARQAIAFFEKLEPLGAMLDVDREQAAIAKFLDSERVCAETNELFSAYRRGKLCFTPTFEHILHAAKWKIDKVLGTAPDFRSLRPKLGPGASTTVTRRKACPAEKLGQKLSCSTNFAPFLPLFMVGHPHLMHHHAEHSVEGEDDVWRLEFLEEPGKLTFVEKDAKSFRSIVIEPVLSSMYQLAIGDVIAARLRVNGIDITNQVLNQNLARYGSVSGALATLDLSSASDSISSELVRFLLPQEWYSLLDGFRSPTVDYDGRLIHLEKFSSMGNGATFPLETLIFYALTWASSPHHERSYLSVYGDDIVCGSLTSGVVIETLEFCGFTVNTKKSFTEGPFRESCGADYYLGVDIRPYRLKRLVNGEVLFTMHNFFRRNHDDDMCNLILSYVHPDIQLWGPDGYGDGHLICQDPPLRAHKRAHGWGGYTFDTYTLRARKSVRVHPGDYLQVLYTNYVAETAPTYDEKMASLRAEKLEVSPSKSQAGRVVKSFPLHGVRKYSRISVYTLTA